MKRIFLAFAFVSWTLSMFANGDPVVEFSAMTLSRTPVSRHIPEIQIVHEWLDIYPADMHTRVHVRYRLHNTSDKDFTDIRYGFPIDWYGTNDSITFTGRDMIFESQREVGWRDDYVTHVSFALNGKTLAWQCSKDSILHEAGSWEELEATFENEEAYSTYLEEEIGYQSYDFENQLNRRWYYTTLSIPAHSIVDLTVDYSLANTYTLSLSEPTEALKDAIDTWRGAYYNPREIENLFSYDFSPAAAWGNGKADTIEVKVHTQNIVQYPEAGSPEYNIHGIAPDTLSNGDLRFVASPFDYAAAEPLTLAFMAKRVMKENLDYIFSHRLTPDKYTVYLKQGEDSTVVEERVSDLNFKTSTRLPFKKGETELRIHFNQPEHVTGVILLNGNCKNAVQWKSSPKIKMMEANGSNSAETYESYAYRFRPFCFGHYRHYKTDKWPYYEYIDEPAPCRLTPPKEFTWEGVIAAADKMNVANIESWLAYRDGTLITDTWERERITDLYFTISETTDMKAFTLSEIIILTSPPDESVYGSFTYTEIYIPFE